MTQIFIYGRLLDRQLLDVIVGRSGRDWSFVPATLPGFALLQDPDTGLPVLSGAAGRAVQGQIISGIGDEDLARLDFFEAAFGGHRERIQVRFDDGAIDVDLYMTSAEMVGRPEATNETRLPAGSTDWKLADWQAADGGLTAETAREFMDLFGRVLADDAAPLFGPMRARAMARMNARDPRYAPPPAPSGFDASDVHTEKLARPYTDYFTLEERWLSFARFNGGQSEVVKRAVFITGDAVTVLPYDPATDHVLLVEQFRAGPMGRRDPSPWLLEPVAGRIDAGGSPQETGHRECMEEAGITLRALEKIAHYYPSPGTFAEYLYSFVGIADLSGAGGVHGLASEQEDIRVHVLPFGQAFAMIEDGSARNAPLILSLQWLSAHRERLQGTYRRD